MGNGVPRGHCPLLWLAVGDSMVTHRSKLACILYFYVLLHSNGNNTQGSAVGVEDTDEIRCVCVNYMLGHTNVYFSLMKFM